MHKYNKIRGVLRAKQGSQIPKFYNGNSFNTGTEFPEDLPDSMMNDGNKNYLDESTLVGSPKFGPMSDPKLNPFNTTMPDMKNFKIPIDKTIKIKPPLLKTAGNIIGNNANVIGLGLSLAGNMLFGETKNSGTYNTINLGLEFASSIPGIGKWFKLGLGVLNFANAAGGSTVDNTYINLDFANKAGGSYNGTMFLGLKAMANNGVQFGMFNRGGYRSAKRTRGKFLALQGVATGVINEAADLRAMVNDLNYLNYDTNTNGIATDPLTYRALSTKLGGTLTQKINLVKSRKFNQIINVDTKLVEEFKEGGIFLCHVDNSSINYPVCKLEWEPVIELFEEWEPEIILEIEEFKDGGTIKEELETPEIEETNQKNLIPEGALHKNKHHIEHTEGLTLKGIPVIDNEGEQLAEIELDEIIFTLEVTKKLEELYKEGTDEAAIEAGKLLVKEILFNTDDRTGLISKCEKGGKL